MNALLMNVPIGLFKVECAFGMERSPHTKDAAAKDALMKLSKEECVEDMGQSLSYAAVMDAQIML